MSYVKLVNLLLENEFATPKWGIMDMQNMVEHLSKSFELSMGMFMTNFTIDESKASKIKHITLGSARPLPLGIKTPLLPLDSVLPNEQASFALAVSSFMTKIVQWKTFIVDNPLATNPHPIMGLLNNAEWKIMHTKHIIHHLKQFGLENTYIPTILD